MTLRFVIYNLFVVAMVFLAFSLVLVPDALAACYVNGKEVPCAEALKEAKRVLSFVQQLLSLIFRFVGGS